MWGPDSQKEVSPAMYFREQSCSSQGRYPPFPGISHVMSGRSINVKLGHGGGGA